MLKLCAHWGLELMAAALALCVVGCFEVKQDIWVYADGTGRMRIDVSLDGTIAALVTSGSGKADMDRSLAEMRANLKKDPNVAAATVELVTQPGTMHIVIDFTVKDITQLGDSLARFEKANAGKQGETRMPTYDLRIERGDGDTLSFLQVVQEGSKGDSNSELAQSIFEGKHFTFRLHAPHIVTSNGEVVDGEHGQPCVQWKYSIPELNDGVRRELQAELGLAPGSGGWRLALMAVVGAGMAVVVFFLGSRRRQAGGKSAE